MQKSSSSPGESYKNALLSHQDMMLYQWWLCAIHGICHLLHDGYKMHLFFVEACWYKYFPVFISYGNVIGDGGSVLRQLMLRDCLFCTNLLTMSTLFDPYLVKLCSKMKSSVKGHIFWPHLKEVHSMTKSSDKGHILDHIWLNSAVRQSPPKRGTFWTTFGQSPQQDKVLQQGAHNWTTFGQSQLFDKVLHWGASFFCPIWPMSTAWQVLWWGISFSCHIWLKSAAWHVLQQGANFLFRPNLSNASCWIVHFFECL